MKFAEPLCEPGAAGGVGAGGHAPIWMRPLSARSSPVTSPEQRLRPYSSPGRGLLDVVERAPDERVLAASCFSLHPPALPMWLVAAPLPTLSPLPPMSPQAALISAPFDEEQCKNAVRSVLYELSALLPLCPVNPIRPTSARCPRSPHSAVAFYADTEHRKISLLDDKTQIVDTSTSAASKGAAGSTGSAGSVGSTGSERSAGSLHNARQSGDMRHVATQAHDPGNVRRADRYPDEWLGGVRALRDSYVRLVLRQLRHIERLNRALDLFAGTATARAPRAPRLPRKLRTCSLTRSR